MNAPVGDVSSAPHASTVEGGGTTRFQTRVPRTTELSIHDWDSDEPDEESGKSEFLVVAFDRGRKESLMAGRSLDNKAPTP